MYGIENPQSSPFIPLRRGIKGEDWGCKLVLVKTGITQGKTQPPESPFVKGDCVGITYKDFEQL